MARRIVACDTPMISAASFILKEIRLFLGGLVMMSWSVFSAVMALPEPTNLELAMKSLSYIQTRKKPTAPKI
jgi:hypothetical protein